MEEQRNEHPTAHYLVLRKTAGTVGDAGHPSRWEDLGVVTITDSRFPQPSDALALLAESDSVQHGELFIFELPEQTTPAPRRVTTDNVRGEYRGFTSQALHTVALPSRLVELEAPLEPWLDPGRRAGAHREPVEGDGNVAEFEALRSDLAPLDDEATRRIEGHELGRTPPPAEALERAPAHGGHPHEGTEPPAPGEEAGL